MKSHPPLVPLDRENNIIKLEYRGLAPRGTVIGGGRPKGRPYGAKYTVFRGDPQPVQGISTP